MHPPLPATELHSICVELHKTTVQREQELSNISELLTSISRFQDQQVCSPMLISLPLVQSVHCINDQLHQHLLFS
jgi:hypothetical protein